MLHHKFQKHEAREMYVFYINFAACQEFIVGKLLQIYSNWVETDGTGSHAPDKQLGAHIIATHDLSAPP